jgi:hypothetical protein
VTKSHRVELVPQPFSGTERGVGAYERSPLLVERYPDIRDVRNWMVIKEVADPSVPTMARQRDVHVMPHIRSHRNFPNYLGVHLVDTDLGGFGAVRIRDVPGDRAR